MEAKHAVALGGNGRHVETVENPHKKHVQRKQLISWLGRKSTAEMDELLEAAFGENAAAYFFGTLQFRSEGQLRKDRDGKRAEGERKMYEARLREIDQKVAKKKAARDPLLAHVIDKFEELSYIVSKRSFEKAFEYVEAFHKIAGGAVFESAAQFYGYYRKAERVLGRQKKTVGKSPKVQQQVTAPRNRATL